MLVIALAGLLALSPAAPKARAAGRAAAKADAGKSDKDKSETRLKAETFAGLELRNIGPAVTSGRVVDIVVHPTERGTWYVATGSGGVFKTVNAGTTWTPIFDGQGSY